MRAQTPKEHAQLEALRSAYEEAFQQFSLQVNLLQSLHGQPTPDKAAIEEASRWIDQARMVYRENRDNLVQFMLGLDVTDMDREVDWHSRVESLAHHLWEESGRPTDKSEEHWYRAEMLLRNAPDAAKNAKQPILAGQT